MSVSVELDQIQGLLIRGHGRLREARFLLLKVTDPARARAYLGGLIDRLDYGDSHHADTALHVAFTRAGLRELGVPERVLGTFSREFIEGMEHPDRATVLGDRGIVWEWNPTVMPIHVLLLVYAKQGTLAEVLRAERTRLDGFEILEEHETQSLGGDLEEHRDKEHFGWKDGLSMPKFLGVDRKDKARKPDTDPEKKQWWTSTALQPGEFILGYRNEYNAFTQSPSVEPHEDPANHLRARDGRKDLGRNGTYLVFREMTQDVFAFWRYLAEQSRDDATEAIALGAKMVGRWPSGAPLITKDGRFQPHDDPKQAFDNKFMYGKDLDGLHCPKGSHIRRASPRDVLALDDRSPEASISMVRRHQMIRRGRPYGPPISKTMDPREILKTKPDGVRRGLHFICLVGDINRQFEFVQRAWMDSANFDSLYRDGDPISATRRSEPDPNPNDEFTCPAHPVRRRYKKLPQFTTLVGGAYFFMPGRAALRYIAQVPR